MPVTSGKGVVTSVKVQTVGRTGSESQKPLPGVAAEGAKTTTDGQHKNGKETAGLGGNANLPGQSSVQTLAQKMYGTKVGLRGVKE